LYSNLKKTPGLHARTKIVICKTDNRSALLNHALGLIQNGLMVVFDDDDIPLSNFVQVIRSTSSEAKTASIIRTSVGQVETLRVTVNGEKFQTSVSKMQFLWPRIFNRLDHLSVNRTPCMAVSYPVELIKRKKLKWDEALHAVEDWDFFMRATDVIPVVSITTATSIYRRAAGQYRSKLNSTPEMWRSSESIVREKLNKLHFNMTGSEILHLSSETPTWEKTPLRAEIFVQITHFLQPRLIQTPNLYVRLKGLYGVLVKLLRIEKYV
jgi:hypothetical protein